VTIRAAGKGDPALFVALVGTLIAVAVVMSLVVGFVVTLHSFGTKRLLMGFSLSLGDTVVILRNARTTDRRPTWRA